MIRDFSSLPTTIIQNVQHKFIYIVLYCIVGIVKFTIYNSGITT